MSTQLPTTEKKPHTIKSFFDQETVKSKFNEILGKKSQGFITSVLQIAASNDLLKNADPMSIFNAACVAATLDLPINNSLGFAYIIPYKTTVTNDNNGQRETKIVAQFQLGYKGFIQLAQRSGQFKTISATPIYEGQFISGNPLKGYEFDFNAPTKDKAIIGFAGYFSLINGFEKTLYMSSEEMISHGVKYSKTYKTGVWQSDFIGMGNKTVIKLLLSKFAPLSIEMQKAVLVDQGIINDESGTDVTYIDNSKSINYDDKLVELMDLFNEKEHILLAEDVEHIKRIINEKEERSYVKAITTLKQI